MKKNITILLMAFCAFALVTTSCKKTLTKSQGSTYVSFAGTTFDSLGSSNFLGVPNYLAPPDSISPALTAFVDSILPEHIDLTKTHPELFATDAQAVINITQTSSVSVTFVSEGADYSNTIAFYTYPTNDPPKVADSLRKITYIFDNAGAVNSGGGLKPGDKVVIGTFAPGTSIGFVMMENSWNENTKIINTKSTLFLSQDALNPENDPNLKRHVILIPYAPQNITLIGFEDTDRSSSKCDNDFNDIVFYTAVKAD